MSDVLINILKGDDKKSITNTIIDFKSNMDSIDVISIAKNSSVKDLDKHKVYDDHTLFKTNKGVPAHVKAALYYNDILKFYKVPFKYEPMKSGDKIKWVYLVNNPLGLDSLALNGWNDPPEVLDFVNTYVDHNRLFETELKNKLQDFYDAMKWGPLVTVETKANDFFSF